MTRATQKGEKIYPIGEAARKLGLSVPTLRLYEKEGLVIPHKTGTSRRFFSPLDLQIIRAVHRIIQEKGLNFAGIRRLLALLPCWEMKPCCAGAYGACPVPEIDDRPCWSVKETHCRTEEADCRSCTVYARAANLLNLKKMIHRGPESTGKTQRVGRRK